MTGMFFSYFFIFINVIQMTITTRIKSTCQACHVCKLQRGIWIFSDIKYVTSKRIELLQFFNILLYLGESTGNCVFKSSSYSRSHMCPHLNGLFNLFLLQPLLFQLKMCTWHHFVFQRLHYTLDLKEGKRQQAYLYLPSCLCRKQGWGHSCC